MHIETERKFLIERPDLAFLASQEGCAVLSIVQTYLTHDSGESERRIRQITEGDRTSFVCTVKRRLSAVSRTEDEREISQAEYDALHADAVTELTKTRYRFPFEEHLIEIDVYPDEIGGEGLRNRAVLEVELDSEDEAFLLPEWVTVLRELTGTREFSNKALAMPVSAEV